MADIQSPAKYHRENNSRKYFAKDQLLSSYAKQLNYSKRPK